MCQYYDNIHSLFVVGQNNEPAIVLQVRQHMWVGVIYTWDSGVDLLMQRCWALFKNISM